MKKRKKLILILIIMIPIILVFIPIKFVCNNPDDQKEFYIVQYVSEGSTEGGSWVAIGCNKENWKDGVYISLKGENPKSILSYDICNGYTQFIMYGDLSKKFDESSNKEVYSLNCYKWEIYHEVRRRKHSFRIPFKNFITIYDLNWFDFLLSDKG